MSVTRQVLKQRRDHESRNVTFIAPDGAWPVVWERAQGVHVWDVEGKKYLDLTAAFGVAAAGHANPNVVRAGQKQMAKLLHAMGDVHPHALKARLAGELSRLTFERWTTKSKVQNPKFRTAKSSLPAPVLKPSRRRSRRPCSPPAKAASSRLPAVTTVSATARSTPPTANIFAARSARNCASLEVLQNFPRRRKRWRESRKTSAGFFAAKKLARF